MIIIHIRHKNNNILFVHIHLYMIITFIYLNVFAIILYFETLKSPLNVVKRG